MQWVKATEPNNRLISDGSYKHTLDITLGNENEKLRTLNQRIRASHDLFNTRLKPFNYIKSTFRQVIDNHDTLIFCSSEYFAPHDTLNKPSFWVGHEMLM